MDGLIELAECAKYLNKAEKFAFDLETTGLDPRTDRIRGVGVASDERQWYFQVSGKDSIPLQKVKEGLSTVFGDREKLCIGHNLKFDLQFCKTHDTPISCKIGDTMILAYALDENRSNTGRLSLKGKGGLIDELFGVELSGWEESDLSGNLFGKPEAVYAKADVEWTMRCWNKLVPNLSHYPAIKKFYWDVSMKIIPIIAEMELSGMHVNTDYLLEYQGRLQKEAELLENEFKQATGTGVSIGSPAALSRFLFDDESGLKLRPTPWMKKGKSGLYSTDEGTISRYAKDYPLCQMILDWRGKNKLLSTYVGPFMDRANKGEGKRIYGSISQTGTVTGRFCVAWDTVLETSEGSVFISELDLTKHPESSILTHRGRQRKILQKIYKGKESMYEVRDSQGNTIKCTASHRFLTRYGWKRLRDISIGDSIISQRRRDNSLLKAQQRIYADNFREDVSGISNVEGDDGFLSGSSRNKQDAVLSSAECLWNKVSERAEREGERELFQSNEREQARGERQTYGVIGSRRTSGIGGCGVGSLQHIQNNEDNGISSEKQSILLRDSREGINALSEIPSSSGIVCESSGDIQSWNRPEGKGFSQRSERVFSCHVRSIPERSGSEVCNKGISESTSVCSVFRPDSEGSHQLVRQSWGGNSFLGTTPKKYTAHTAVSNRELDGGFSDRREAHCRSRWGISSKRCCNYEERQEASSISGVRGVHGFALHGEGGAEGRREVCNRDFKESQVVSITYVGIQDVWDIEVEEDHSYVAGGFVNHNSSANPNLQNLPRDKDSMRKAFSAPPGKKLLVADYSQLELRLMAHMSQDAAMLEIYRTGGDIHDNTLKALGLTERTVAKNCVAEGSEVLTENGYVPIEEIVGDTKEGWGKAPNLKIESYDGLRKIDKVYYGGVKPCRRVETDYGIVVDQTLDHEMPIVRDGKITMVKTEDLVVGDLAIIKVGAEVHGNSGKMTVPKVEKNTSYKDVFIPDVVTEDWAKFLGYYVSEGSMTINDVNHYRIGVGFGGDEAEISSDFSKLISRLFAGRFKETRRKDGAYIFVLTSKKICQWLQNESAGHISGVKRIPRCVQSAPWHIKKSFLQSLFEGDGTVKKNPWTVSITSKSEVLIRQVQSELMNVGIVGCIHKETRKDYGDFWVWVTYDLAGFKEKVDFISERKKARIRTPVKVENRSVVFLDGFESQLSGMQILLKGKDRNKITECLTHRIRFGKSRITPGVKGLLQGSAKLMVDNGLWTSRIRKLADVGERKVYDIYEPKHKVMLISPLVTGDCNFGLIYGLYPQGLKDQLWAKAKIDKSLEECGQWRAGFFIAYPGIPRYHNHVEAFLNTHSYVKTLTGRRRHLQELLKKDFKQALRMAINYTIQGSAADIMLIAMRNIKNVLDERRLHDVRWNDVLMLMQVHDELVFEVPEDLTEDVSKVVKDGMENAVKLSIPLEVDPGVSDNWEEAKG